MGRVFGTYCNGEVEIRLLTSEYVEAALEVMNSSFYPFESVCIGTEINLELPDSLQARKELNELCRITNRDGVSLVAVHLPSNRVVGVALNKIQLKPEPTEKPFFVDYKNYHCTSPNAKALMEYMITMDEKIDPFELFKIDCLLEHTFLGVSREFRGKKLGHILAKHSIEIARNLFNGTDTSLLSDELKGKRPKAVTALFTSKISQKIGDALGFQVLNEVPYTEFMFKGKTFADRIGPQHPTGRQLKPEPTEKPFFVDYKNYHCTSPNAKALMEYMITMDEKIDPFELFKIDCLLEHTFLGVSREFRGKKLGHILAKHGIEIAQNLFNGTDTSLLSDELKGKRPKAVTALFTSKISQKIGDALGFQVLNEVPYTEFMFKGKTFADRIGPQHPTGRQVIIKF